MEATGAGPLRLVNSNWRLRAESSLVEAHDGRLAGDVLYGHYVEPEGQSWMRLSRRK
jgi:hypothetical protein